MMLTAVRCCVPGCEHKVFANLEDGPVRATCLLSQHAWRVYAVDFLRARVPLPEEAKK